MNNNRASPEPCKAHQGHLPSGQPSRSCLFLSASLVCAHTIHPLPPPMSQPRSSNALVFWGLRKDRNRLMKALGWSPPPGPWFAELPLGFLCREGTFPLCLHQSPVLRFRAEMKREGPCFWIERKCKSLAGHVPEAARRPFPC